MIHKKTRVIIDDVEIMAHIVINLPEKYYNIIENLEGKLDDDIDMLTIKIIWDKLLPKNYRMNV